MSKALILLVLFFSAGLLFSQGPHPAFRQYTVEDGLAGSDVYQVRQDSKGYLWFATGNGVSRFNGYEFENFTVADGLPDNTVFEVFEDSRGRVWFVPISCKLSYYENGKIHQYKYNTKLQEKLRNPIKSSFFVDSAGSVYLGVTNAGIFKVTEDGSISRLQDSDGIVNAVEIEKVGEHDFLYSSNNSDRHEIGSITEGNRVQEIKFPFDARLIPANARLIALKDGQLLLSFFDQLLYISRDGALTSQKLSARINWLYEDTDGDLWVGTMLDGVLHFPGGDLKKGRSYLPELTVDGIIEDREGGFWFATEGYGVYYTPSKNFLVYDEKAGLAGNKVNVISRYGEQVFVGLNNGFVHTIHAGVAATTNCNLTEKKVNGINSLYYDKEDGNLWVSGFIKNGSIRNGKFSPQEIQYPFNRMLKDSSGIFWFAKSTGLEKIENNIRSRITNDDGIVKRINGMVEAPDGTLLLGTMNGLWSYDKKNKWDYKAAVHRLLSNRVLDIAITKEGIIVLGTKGQGVLLFDGKNVRQISTPEGLYGGNVYRVHVDGQRIWVATNKGLNCITLYGSVQDSISIKGLSRSDGLASNELCDVLVLGTKVWVASNGGVTTFDSTFLSRKKVSLPVYITRLKLNERDTTLSSYLQLPYDLNNVSISFIALGYRDPGKQQYRYRMSGLNKEWLYTSSREARFTTLPTGSYKFEVQALDGNGVWQPAASSISLEILAPFWKRLWFQILYVAAAIGVIVLIFRYRQKKQQEEDDKNIGLYKVLMNLKLKALRAQMNPHFTFNVMTSIQHFIINKDEESAIRYLSKFSKLMRAILNNSERNQIRIAEEIKVIELYLELEAMRFEEKFDYEILVDPAIDPENDEIPSMLIQPYIENAVKHGITPLKRRGRITVTISKSDDMIKCSIEDNGVGTAYKSQTEPEHQSFGSAITEERLAAMNALNNSRLSARITDLYDEAGEPCGTRVEIFIPLYIYDNDQRIDN